MSDETTTNKTEKKTTGGGKAKEKKATGRLVKAQAGQKALQGGAKRHDDGHRTGEEQSAIWILSANAAYPKKHRVASPTGARDSHR